MDTDGHGFFRLYPCLSVFIRGWFISVAVYAALGSFVVFLRARLMETAEIQSRPRLPEWLRIKLPTSDSFARTRGLLDELKLHTVCESAKCPNHWECWSKGTATFMIAGDRCTRACGC